MAQRQPGLVLVDSTEAQSATAAAITSGNVIDTAEKLHKNYEWLRQSATVIGFFRQKVAESKVAYDGELDADKLRLYKLFSYMRDEKPFGENLPKLLRRALSHREKKKNVKRVLKEWQIQAEDTEAEKSALDKVRESSKTKKYDYLIIANNLLRWLEEDKGGGNMPTAKLNQKEALPDEKQDYQAYSEKLAKAVFAVSPEALMNRVFNNDVRNVILGGNKEEKERASPLSFIVPTFEWLLSAIAFGESIHDYHKSRRLVNNFNAWYERELVIYSRLTHELKELESIEKMHEVKKKRDVKAGKPTTDVIAYDEEKLSYIEGQIFFGKLAELNNFSSLAEYKDALIGNLNKYLERQVEKKEEKENQKKESIKEGTEKNKKYEGWDITTYSSNQLTELRIALEKRYIKGYISYEEELINARFKLHIFRKNKQLIKTNAKIAKINNDIAEINQCLKNNKGKFFYNISAVPIELEFNRSKLESKRDKLVKRINEIKGQLKETDATTDLLLAKSPFYDDLMKAKKEALELKEGFRANENEPMREEDLKAIEKPVLDDLMKARDEKRNKFLSRFALFLLFTASAVGVGLLVFCPVLGMPVIGALIATGLAGGILHAIAEYIVLGATKVMKNSVYSLPSRVSKHGLFKDARAQAIFDAKKGKDEVEEAAEPSVTV